MFRRLFKYSFIGSACFAGVYTYKISDDLNNLALVRLMRCAVAAYEIGSVYKKKLYAEGLEKKSDEYYRVKSECDQIGAQRLLELCKANKGIYIKLGQHLGALDYLIPMEYVKTLKVLHSDAPRNTLEQVYQVIKEELRQKPEDLFIEFDKEPLGTASLAQVHRAVLKDGTEVAVKVQHPYVRKNVEIDLHTVEFIINVMSKVFPEFQMEWLIDETKKNIKKELNFCQEGKNAEKVADLFKEYKWLKVPKIFWHYSTSRVLTMEYVKGGQVDNYNYIKEHKIDTKDLSQKIGDLYSHMIFVEGFVHSDPHPGNVLIKKDPTDKDVTIYLLDHGLYADLTEKFRYHYSKLWLSIIYSNTEAMRHHSSCLGIKGELYKLFTCMVSGRTWDSVIKGIGTVKPDDKEREMFKQGAPALLAEITECLQKVDRQALLVLKTNDLIRSIEYSIKTQDKMYGFTVMTKCCLKSSYNLEYKTANSFAQRSYIVLSYSWIFVTMYLYSVLLSIQSMFHLDTNGNGS